jgi:hypothetical protein
MTANGGGGYMEKYIGIMVLRLIVVSGGYMGGNYV